MSHQGGLVRPAKQKLKKIKFSKSQAEIVLQKKSTQNSLKSVFRHFQRILYLSTDYRGSQYNSMDPNSVASGLRRFARGLGFLLKWFAGIGGLSVSVVCRYRWSAGVGSLPVSVVCRYQLYAGIDSLPVSVVYRYE